MQGLRPFCAIMKRYAGINFKKSQFHHLTAKVGLTTFFHRSVRGLNLKDVVHIAIATMVISTVGFITGLSAT